MNTSNLYNDIIRMVSMLKNDDKKLWNVYSLLENEFSAKKQEMEKQEIPEEYRDIVSQIINAMDNGFFTYLNPDTLEMEQVSHKGLFDPEEFEEQHDDKMDDYDLVYTTWDRSIKFEPLSHEQLYDMMEDFISSIDSQVLSDKLEDVLNKRLSFFKFQEMVEASKYRKKWFNFKHDYMENIVKTTLFPSINF
ncbi:MAG: hypothetical protein LUG18_15775 [Candidatus Azobacteroides sp.]|nr:hypothetical protein [Candidatus Azobacteroides sp.]